MADTASAAFLAARGTRAVWPDVTSPVARFKLSVRAYFPDARRRDLDNLIKSVADALNGVAYRDDTQIVQLGESEKHVDKLNPRTEVRLEVVPWV